MDFTILLKAIVVHTTTYFFVGFCAFTVFNYKAKLPDYFRPASSPIVKAGVLFQPIRGLLFGIVFYLLKDILFQQADGWLIMWVMLVLVGILSTFSATPSSIEGFIYMKPTSPRNWGGTLEILTQSFLLAGITYVWVNHPEWIWLTWLMGILFVVALALPVLGLLAATVQTSKHA